MGQSKKGKLNDRFQLAIEQSVSHKKPLNAFLVKNANADSVEQVDSTDTDYPTPDTSESQINPTQIYTDYNDTGNLTNDYVNKYPNYSHASPKVYSSLKKSYSNSDLPNDFSNKPARRYSVCDLNTTSPRTPISPVDVREKPEYFGHHHRRNSVALKFRAPKTLDDN